MGQAQSPLSPLSQQINNALAVVSSPTGTATFTFAAPPDGSTWTGTLTCSGAPSGAIWTATVAATNWGQWAGGSVFGPIQCFGNQQLVVTGSSLNPNTTYEMEWTGSSDPSSLVAPIWPDTNSSAQIVQFSEPSLIFAGTGTAAPQEFTVPQNTRTLIIVCYGAPEFVFTSPVIVQGGSPVLAVVPAPVFTYFSDIPYFSNFFDSGESAWDVVPVPAAVGGQFWITGATGLTLEIYADPLNYTRASFFTGTLQAASVQTNATILFGPARLLTWSLAAGAAGSQLAIYKQVAGAVEVLETVTNPSTSGYITASGNFPDGTVLSRGDYVLTQGGGSSLYASIGWAYP